jgi:hypothetical protein
VGSIPIARSNMRHDTFMRVIGPLIRFLHQMTAVVKTNVSFQAVKVPGPASDPKQLVVRRVNWKDIKERTEEQAARTFCDLCDRKDWKLKAPDQNDPVDIKACSPDGKSTEHFQIVRLWDEAAWKDLNTKDAVDRCFTDQEAIDLLRQRLAGKGPKKYPDAVRGTLVLLIDASPIGNASRFFAGIEGSIKSDAQAVGYKAVWIVGTADVHRID